MNLHIAAACRVQPLAQSAACAEQALSANQRVSCSQYTDNQVSLILQGLTGNEIKVANPVPLD